MLIKDLANCQEIVAGDETLLRELLNPHKEPLELRYSLAHAVVKPMEITKRHRLRSSEVYYILEGEGEMYIDGKREKVKPGQAIYIPPGSIQQIRNIGLSHLQFLCIVDPAWRPEIEEIIG